MRNFLLRCAYVFDPPRILAKPENRDIQRCFPHLERFYAVRLFFDCHAIPDSYDDCKGSNARPPQLETIC